MAGAIRRRKAWFCVQPPPMLSQVPEPQQARAAEISLPPPPPAAAPPSPPFTQILNGKVSLGDTTGDTNVMGAAQASTQGVGTLSWHHPGDPISVPRASWTQTGPAFALRVANIPQPQALGSPQPCTRTDGRTDAPIRELRRRPQITAQPLAHRWPHTGRAATWGRLGKHVSGESQRAWQEQLSALSLSLDGVS